MVMSTILIFWNWPSQTSHSLTYILCYIIYICECVIRPRDLKFIQYTVQLYDMKHKLMIPPMRIVYWLLICEFDDIQTRVWIWLFGSEKYFNELFSSTISLSLPLFPSFSLFLSLSISFSLFFLLITIDISITYKNYRNSAKQTNNVA